MLKSFVFHLRDCVPDPGSDSSGEVSKERCGEGGEHASVQTVLWAKRNPSERVGGTGMSFWYCCRCPMSGGMVVSTSERTISSSRRAGRGLKVGLRRAEGRRSGEGPGRPLRTELRTAKKRR